MDKNTLAIAQRQTLTGYPKFTEDQDFREPPPPPPTTIILEALKPHHDGLTRHTLFKQTGLDPETAQIAIDELVALGKIEPVKRQGWKRYAVAKPGRPHEGES